MKLVFAVTACFRDGATISHPYRSRAPAPLRTGQADFPYIRLLGRSFSEPPPYDGGSGLCGYARGANQRRHTLQSQRTDTVLLTRHIPHSRKPTAQRRARLCKHRSSGNCTLIVTSPAHESCPLGSIRFIHSPTSWTDKPVRPAQLLQVPQTRGVVGKPIEKLIPCTGEITS